MQRKKRFVKKIFPRSRGLSLVSQVHSLQRQMNSEKKYIDVSFTTTSSTTVAFTNINGIQLGTTATTRLGQSLKIVSVYVNGYWDIPSFLTPFTAYCRLIVFIDKQANGATPSASDILTPATVLGAMVVGNSKRFKILMDVRKHISTVGPATAIVRRFKRVSIKTEYNTGNAGTVADIQTNSMFLMHMSDIAAANGPPSFFADVRSRFVDN